MTFNETRLKGAYMIELEPVKDARGFFARSWCREEFRRQGLSTELIQCNISFNAACGTLRGMHYQAEPYGETKLVRCTMGAIYDVIVDLRRDSATFKEWFGVELSAATRRMLYVPVGFAHGFLTLDNDCEVFYQMSELYAAQAARGFRWDDPAFGIRWPAPPRIVSATDQSYRAFNA